MRFGVNLFSRTLLPGFAILCAVAIGEVSPMNAFADTPAKTAKGALHMGKTTIQLSYSYAVAQKNSEMLILLSDNPLTNEDLKDVFSRIHRAKAGDLNCLEVTLDKKRTPVSVSFRYKDMETSGGGGSTEDKYVHKSYDGKVVSGRVSRLKPGPFSDENFTYDVTFDAPLWTPPPPTYTGEAAKNSPQAKIAVEFMKAGREGNVAALKKTVDKQGKADLDGPDGKEIIEMMKDGEDPAKLIIKGVYVDGDKGEVEFAEKDPKSSTSITIKVILENGEWKVGK
jgi:hypothetical protein